MFAHLCPSAAADCQRMNTRFAFLYVWFSCVKASCSMPKNKVCCNNKLKSFSHFVLQQICKQIPTFYYLGYNCAANLWRLSCRIKCLRIEHLYVTLKAYRKKNPIAFLAREGDANIQVGLQQKSSLQHSGGMNELFVMQSKIQKSHLRDGFAA